MKSSLLITLFLLCIIFTLFNTVDGLSVLQKKMLAEVQKKVAEKAKEEAAKKVTQAIEKKVSPTPAA